MIFGVLDTPSAWVVWEGDNSPWGAMWVRMEFVGAWTATFCCAVSVTHDPRAGLKNQEIPTYAIVELRSMLTPVHHPRL